MEIFIRFDSKQALTLVYDFLRLVLILGWVWGQVLANDQLNLENEVNGFLIFFIDLIFW